MTSSSFSDLLNSPTDQNLGDTEKLHHQQQQQQHHVLSDQTGSGVPKFKSIPPPSLPLSPTSLFSPSSYFSIPPGFSLSELLDSPVLLNSSHIFPSPTTGSFANNNNNQGFNWKNNYGEKQHNIKAEDENFSFQTQSGLQSLTGWSFEETNKQDGFSSMVKTENSSSIQNFTPPENNHKSNLQSNYKNYNQQPQQQVQTLSRRSDDGYNWRKYGQKQVKGSENPRSYYKCTYPNCPTKKKVEKRSLDGQITEIVYKGNHNHPKPQPNKRNINLDGQITEIVYKGNHNHPKPQPNKRNINSTSHANPSSNHFSSEIQMDLVATPDNSWISMGGDDDFEQSSHVSVGDHEDESDAKRWRIEGENEGISGGVGNRTVREPRVVVQTTSDIDILDDGYRWRKYGQKVVKGNPNPRSYYKCTNPGCPVRKHVERASQDLRAVITTYEGKHNHDVPVPRGSGNHSINKPLPMPTNNNNNAMINNSLHNNGFFNQGSFNGSFPMDHSYMNMNQQRVNIVRGRPKEEPTEDDSFFESLLS